MKEEQENWSKDVINTTEKSKCCGAVMKTCPEYAFSFDCEKCHKHYYLQQIEVSSCTSDDCLNKIKETTEKFFPTEPVIEDWEIALNLVAGEKINNIKIYSRSKNDYMLLSDLIHQTRLDLLNEIEGEMSIRIIKQDEIDDDFIAGKSALANQKMGINKGLQVGVDVVRSKMK